MNYRKPCKGCRYAPEKAKRLVEHKKDVVIFRQHNAISQAHNLIYQFQRPHQAVLTRLHRTSRNGFLGGKKHRRRWQPYNPATALIETGSRMDDVLLKNLREQAIWS